MICQCFAAALLLQSEVGVVSLLRDASTASKVVLLILLIFSIWSWGIILSKALLLRRVRKESEIFWKMFHKGKNLSEISTACETLRFTPLVPVFQAAAELLDAKAKPASLASIQRSLQRTSAAQLTLLESRLIFLATTASVAPFIGLFGTVWGVLTSFMGLSNSDTATLRAVGPGIAEALIATAAGLFTAIPAVMGYNQFLSKVRNLGGQLDDLQVEILDIAERSGR